MFHTLTQQAFSFFDCAKQEIKWDDKNQHLKEGSYLPFDRSLMSTKAKTQFCNLKKQADPF